MAVRISCMKNFLFLWVLIGCSFTGFAQTTSDGYYRIIKEQADRMQEYLIKEDFDRYAGCMHPTFIKDVGGVQEVAKYFKKIEQSLRTEGYQLKQHQVGELSPLIHHNNQLQGVLTLFLTYQIHDQQMLTHTHWLVVSEDHGNTWQFLEVTGQNNKTIRDKIPEISPDLLIPEPIDPIYLEEGAPIPNI
jgi:hypothetical protein